MFLKYICSLIFSKDAPWRCFVSVASAPAVSELEAGRSSQDEFKRLVYNKLNHAKHEIVEILNLLLCSNRLNAFQVAFTKFLAVARTPENTLFF